MRIALAAECRYHGQGFELRALMPGGELAAENLHVVTDSFDDQHHLDYGYRYPTAGVELITIRAIGTALAQRIEIPKVEAADGSNPDRALMFVRPTTFDAGRTLGTPGWVAETLEHGSTRIRPVGA